MAHQLARKWPGPDNVDRFRYGVPSVAGAMVDHS
jgi:hypothetical protein